MSIDATPAPIEADAVREALKWAAAALQAIAPDEDTVRDNATGETRSVGQILDAADAALARAARPPITYAPPSPTLGVAPSGPGASAAPQPAVQHPDDVSVDALAALMKAKLAKQRAKGYGGWDDPACKREWLSALLREHVDKGDPVDVANFCAFLSARGWGIAPTLEAAVRDFEQCFPAPQPAALQEGIPEGCTPAQRRPDGGVYGGRCSTSLDMER